MWLYLREWVLLYIIYVSDCSGVINIKLLSEVVINFDKRIVILGKLFLV